MFKYNKMWVAGIAAPLSAILVDFATIGMGVNMPWVETAIVAGVTGFLTWLVPNEA